MIKGSLFWLILFVTLPPPSLSKNVDKKPSLPKFQVSMLLEQVTSKEAREIRRKQVNPMILDGPNSSASDSQSESDDDLKLDGSDSNSDSPKNTTSTSSEDVDDSTTDLIKSSVSPVAPLNDEDYDTTTAAAGPEEDFNEPESPTSSRPMMLSEFANHLAKGIRGKVETTTQPLPDFPTPKPTVFGLPPDDDAFPFMVTAAKDFIRRYLAPEQWRKLRILLKTIREVGGSRVDIHRAATSYISRVISKTEMAEITERKNELFQTFNQRYFDKIPPR